MKIFIPSEFLKLTLQKERSFMNENLNYGLIIRQLRREDGSSLQMFSKKIGRSVGWLCEIENCSGNSKLTKADFEKIVTQLGMDAYRPMFKTWAANTINSARIDNKLDGAILKHLRIKKRITLEEATQKTSLSCGFISKLENGHWPITLPIRKKLMLAYGYSPSSFKNLACNSQRNQVVPIKYKIGIILSHLSEEQKEKAFTVLRNIVEEEASSQKQAGETL